MESTQEQAAEPKRRHPQLVRLRSRDREIFALLACARYLSTTQLHALAFPGRSECTASNRLAQLAGHRTASATAYLRRTPVPRNDGTLLFVWSLTELGYLIARDHLGRALEPPPPAGSGAFLEHVVGINELFVRIFAESQRCATVRRRGLLWMGSEHVRLPWRQYDPRQGREQSRRLQPDATIEIPARRRRIFLEYETGSQALADAAEPNSTVSKVRRYAIVFKERCAAQIKASFQAWAASKERFPYLPS